MKQYYSAENYYDSDTSIGGANTWEVFSWDSKKNRDEYVESQWNRLSVQAVKRNEIESFGILQSEVYPLSWLHRV